MPTDDRQTPDNVKRQNGKLKQVSEKRLKRAESVLSMREVLDELKDSTDTSNQIAADGFRAMVKSSNTNNKNRKNTTTEMRQVSDGINDLIKIVEKGDSKELDQAKLQVDALRQQADLVVDEGVKNDFLSQLDTIGGHIETETGLVQKSFDFIKNYSDSILGLMTFMVSDSPLLAFMTMEAVKKFKENKERQEQSKAALNESTRARIDALNPVVDAQKKILEQNVEITEQLREANELEEAKQSGDEESRREAARKKDEPVQINIDGKDLDASDGSSGGLMGFLGGKMKGLAGGLLSALAGSFKLLGKLVTSKLMKGAFIAMFIGGIVNGVMEFVNALDEGSTIPDAIMQGLAGFFEFLSGGLISKEKFLEVTNEIGMMIGSFIFDMVQGFGGIIDSVIEVWDKGMLVIQNAATGFVDFIVEKITGIWDWIKNIFTRAIDNFMDTPVIKAIVGGVGSVAGIIDTAGETVFEGIDSAKNFFGFGDDEPKQKEIQSNNLEETRSEVEKIRDEITKKDLEGTNAGQINQTNVQKNENNTFVGKPSARNDDMSIVGI